MDLVGVVCLDVLWHLLHIVVILGQVAINEEADSLLVQRHDIIEIVDVGIEP